MATANSGFITYRLVVITTADGGIVPVGSITIPFKTVISSEITAAAADGGCQTARNIVVTTRNGCAKNSDYIVSLANAVKRTATNRRCASGRFDEVARAAADGIVRAIIPDDIIGAAADGGCISVGSNLVVVTAANRRVARVFENLVCTATRYG